MTQSGKNSIRIGDVISVAICCIYVVGIFSGYYLAHGPYTYTNPDTYIHGLIHMLLVVYLIRIVRRTKMTDTLKPRMQLLVKLGSLAVHVDELLSPGGHAFDKTVIEGLLSDDEVREWLSQMDAMGFLPKKR